MKMKLPAMLFITIFTMAIFSQISSADEYYDIRHYDVVIHVDNDNNYSITETIDVEFYSPRQGIYRDIPTNYMDINHAIKDIRVMNPETGTAYTTSISRSNGETSIRIGDEGTYVEGLMTYVISYKYMGGMDFNKEMDEFYFNLIGAEWDASIDHVTFTVVMPNAFDAKDVNITAGAYGSTDTSNVQWTVKGKSITGETTRPLFMEYVTLALPLPEGYYTGVDASLNLMGLFVYMAFIVLVAIFAFYKNRQLRHNNLIVPVVSFEPPKQLNPAEVAYIYGRESCTNQDLSTLILRWASQGALTIREVKKKLFGTFMEFTKIAELPENTPKYELKLFKAMFLLGRDGVVTTKDMENVFYRSLNEAMLGLRRQFLKEKEIMVNKIQWLSKFFGVLHVLLTSSIFAIVINRLLFNGFLTNFIPALIGGTLLLIGTSIVSAVFKNGSSPGKVILTSIVSLLLLSLLTLVSYLVFNRLLTVLSWQSSSAPVLLLMANVFYLLGLWFMVSCLQYTDYAKDVLGHVEGFREFLRVAKTDQMEVLYQNNPDYVYDILPYAMVLGLTSLWEKHVTKLSVESPTWYHATTMFTPAHMTRSMTNNFASAATSPQSSGSGGSSGGGFSGGGGGGGGGGSW